MKKLKNLLCLVALAAMLTACGAPEDDGSTEKTTQTTTEKQQTTEKNEESETAVFEDYYLVDYAVIAKKLWNESPKYGTWTEVIRGCELCDNDGDGKQELYLTRDHWEFPGRTEVFGVDSYDKPVIAYDFNMSAAGGSDIYVNTSTKHAYMLTDYSTVVLGTQAYMQLTQSGWDMFAYTEYMVDQTANDDGSLDETKTETYQYKGKDVSKEEFEEIEELKGGVRQIRDDKAQVLDIYAKGDISDIESGMKKHLDELGVEYKQFAFDLDKDGSSETVFAVNYYTDKWFNNMQFEDYSVSDEPWYPLDMFSQQETTMIVLSDKGGEKGIKIDVGLLGFIYKLDTITYENSLVAWDVYGNQKYFQYNPYSDKLFEYEENQEEQTQDSGQQTSENGDVTGYCVTSFYGIWCYGGETEGPANDYAEQLRQQGFDAKVFLTTDWSNLNSKPYYVVTAGIYETQEAAEQQLGAVKNVCPDAYIKYTGEYLQDY